MGLTVHYSFEVDGRRDVEKDLEKVRQRAMDLPFEEVGKMRHLRGVECNVERYRGKQDDESQDLCGALIQASADVTDPTDNHRTYMAEPVEARGFTIFVAPGSESMNVTLCKYPPYLVRLGRRIPVKRKGWMGRAFCKTQYASQYGVPNFLRAHISVVTLLEFMQGMKGWKVTIEDEGKWGASHYTDEPYAKERVYTDHPPKHDVKALIEEIGEWNEMIASMFGAMKDAFGEGISSPITDYVDFEHLEARGLKKLEGERLNGFLKVLKDLPRPAVASE
jgi:hypothetical protein